MVMRRSSEIFPRTPTHTLFLIHVKCFHKFYMLITKHHSTLNVFFFAYWVGRYTESNECDLP